MNLRRAPESSPTPGGGVTTWVIGALAVLGALVVARIAIGLLLPLLLVGGLIWLGIRIFGGTKKNRQPETRHQPLHEGRSGDELTALKERLTTLERAQQQQRGPNRGKAPGDDYERRMKELDELEAEIDRALDER